MATKKILDAYKNANREAVVESDDPQALIMLLLDELLRAMRGYVSGISNNDSVEMRKMTSSPALSPCFTASSHA